MSELFAALKHADRQSVIIDARRGNLHFWGPEYPTLPTPGLMAQLKMDSSDPIWIGKLDSDTMYYPLEFLVHFRTFLGSDHFCEMVNGFMFA